MKIWTRNSVRGKRMCRFDKPLWGKPAYVNLQHDGPCLEVIVDGQNNVRYVVQLSDNDLDVLFNAREAYRKDGTWVHVT